MKFYLASALVFLEAALVSGSGCSSLEHFWVGKTMIHKKVLTHRLRNFFQITFQGVQHDILSEAECCGLIDPNFGFNLESVRLKDSLLPTISTVKTTIFSVGLHPPRRPLRGVRARVRRGHAGDGGGVGGPRVRTEGADDGTGEVRKRVPNEFWDCCYLISDKSSNCFPYVVTIDCGILFWRT